VTFVIPKSYKNKAIRVNLVDEGINGGGYGVLQFPPNMLRDGWNVTITESSQQQQDSSSGSNECEKIKPAEKASISIDIKVTDSYGNPVNRFNNSFALKLFGLLKSQEHSACIGYRSRDDEDWSCGDSNTEKQPTKSNSVFVVQSDFDHLTSFAVLLGGSGINECGWGWIEYASMGMIGGSFAFTILMVLLHCFSGDFRAWISGRDERRVMLEIKRRVKLQIEH